MSWWSESEPHWGNDVGASEPKDTQALWLVPGQTRSCLILAVAGPWVVVDSSAGKAGLRSTTALLSSPDFQVQAQQASAVLSRSTPPDPHCARWFDRDLQAPTPGLKAGPEQRFSVHQPCGPTVLSSPAHVLTHAGFFLLFN